MFGIEHSVNCTSLSNMTFETVRIKLNATIKEQFYAVNRSIRNFIEQMNSIAVYATSEVIDMS